jgi:predicted nucleotidyltransferase
MEFHIPYLSEIKRLVNSIGGVTSLVMLSGAHIYGYPSRNSDFDYRGFYIMRTGKLLSFDNVPKHIDRFLDPDKVYDISLMEIQQFIKLAMGMNCNILEHLFAPSLYASSEALELKSIIQKALAKEGIYETYSGMSSFNHKKFILSGKKRTIKKYLYVFRGLLAGIHALQTHEIQPDIMILNEKFGSQVVDQLLQDKLSGLENDEAVKKYEGIDEAIKRFQEEIKQAFIKSTLKYHPDEEDWANINHFIKKVRQKYWDWVE